MKQRCRFVWQAGRLFKSRGFGAPAQIYVTGRPAGLGLTIVSILENLRELRLTRPQHGRHIGPAKTTFLAERPQFRQFIHRMNTVNLRQCAQFGEGNVETDASAYAHHGDRAVIAET